MDTIRAALSSVPDDVPMMDAIRHAVVSANHHNAEDVPQMRMRMNLFATVPAGPWQWNNSARISRYHGQLGSIAS